MLAGSGFCIDKFYVDSALLREPAFAMRGRYNSFYVQFFAQAVSAGRRSLLGQPDVRAPCKLGATGLQRQGFSKYLGHACLAVPLQSVVLHHI